MKFLCVDSSTRYGAVALGDEKRLICGRRRFFLKGRSDGLIALILSCLKKTRTSWGDIDAFGIGVGPGSFTGLRVAVGAVKGLAYGLKKPCFPFSSLDAIAYNRPAERVERLCVLVDARRSNLYSRFYAAEKTRGLSAPSLRRLSDDLLIPLDAFKKKIHAELSSGLGVALTGDGLPLLRASLGASAGFRFLPQKYWYPTPESLWRLTLEAAKRKKRADASRLLPAYLYERDCQVAKQAP